MLGRYSLSGQPSRTYGPRTLAGLAWYPGVTPRLDTFSVLSPWEALWKVLAETISPSDCYRDWQRGPRNRYSHNRNKANLCTQRERNGSGKVTRDGSDSGRAQVCRWDRPQGLQRRWATPNYRQPLPEFVSRSTLQAVKGGVLISCKVK